MSPLTGRTQNMTGLQHVFLRGSSVATLASYCHPRYEQCEISHTNWF